MLYYLLILLSVVMFGGCFGLNNAYRKKRGSSLKVSMESSCIGSLAGTIVLLSISGFSLSFTPFTLCMALLATLNSIALSYCSLKALDYINLSLYSIFMMLGGMILPFLQGLFFYKEAFTLAKGICVLFICAALALTVEKGEKKKGTFFYIAIFILNGLSGVFSKIFTATDLPKATAAEYSLWCSISTVALSGVFWIALAVKDRHSAKDSPNGYVKIERKTRLQSYGIGALNGAINKVANFILVFALLYVDASVQYPMVTGGTMIVSTLLCFFGDKKPSKKEILSVALAFLGMLSLFIIPI